MILKTKTFSGDRFFLMFYLFMSIVFLHPTLVQAQPTATNATEIGSTTFKTNWNAVPNATSYRLDVSTTPFENFNIAGWTFPTNGTDLSFVNNNIESPNNSGKQFISNAVFSVSGGRASRTGWNNATNTDYWQIAVNTIGHSNLRVSAEQTGGLFSPRDFQVQWSLTGNPNNSNEWNTIGAIDIESVSNTNLLLPGACNNQPIVYIRWLKSSNRTVGLSGFFTEWNASRIDNIYVRSVNTATYVQPYENYNVGNVTSHVVTNPNTTPAITPLTNYYYRVRAVTGSGTSNNSNVIPLTTYQNIGIADFRSRTTGNFNNAATWEYSTGLSAPAVTWANATQAPTATNNVVILAPHTVTLTTDFNSSRNVTINGRLATGMSKLTVAGATITVPSGGVVSSANTNSSGAFAASLVASGTGSINFQNGSTFELNGTAKQYLAAGTFFNLRITNPAGVKALGNITVNEQLYLTNNPDLTNGTLDMVNNYGTYATNPYGADDFANSTLAFNNLDSYVLTMGANATTVGPGDVTGKIRRTTIIDNTTYSFGNANTQLSFNSVGGSAIPTQITVVATRGDRGTHIDNTGGVEINGYTANRNTLKRMYQILRTGGAPASRFTLRMAYQDNELNGNTNESNLITWDHHLPYGGVTPHEHGKTSFDTTDNWIELSNHSVAYLSTEGDTSFTKYWMLSTKETTSDYVWLGAVSSNWNLITNWSNSKIPNEAADVLIPNVTSNNNDPILDNSSTYGLPITGTPASSSGVRMRTLEIAPGGILHVESEATPQVTLFGGPNADGGGINYGSWNNQGTFVPGKSKVIFDYDTTASESTISGTTQFYDVEIATGKKATVQAGTEISILNTLVNNGTFDAASLPNTIIYNGTVAQTVLPTTYSNLTIANTNATSGAILGGNTTTLNTLTLSDKILNTSIYKMTMGASAVVSRTTGFVNGTLEKPLTSNPSLFEVGNTFYAPVSITATNLSGEVFVAAKATTGTATASVLSNSAKANVFWTLSKSGTGSIADYNASFDVTNATNTGVLSRYRIAQYVDSGWNILPNPTITGTVITSPAISDFGVFEVGEVRKTIWTGTNWDPILPDIYTDVEIAGPFISTAANAGNFEANSLTINSGQTFEITEGQSVVVANEIINNSTASDVVVQNDANLVQNNEAINTGAITVNRQSSPMLRLDYTFWSTPVLGQHLLAFSPLTLTNRFYLFDTPNNYYINPGFNSTTTFTPGVAYVIRTPNNHSATVPTPYYGVFTGVPNNGKYTFTLDTSGDGHNGIGNPYPSNIDAVKFIDDNPDIEGTLHFFAHTGTGNAGGQFATWTKSGGVAATEVTSGAGNTAAPNGIIPVGQGFVVKSKPSGGTVIFKNEHRVTNSNSQFFRLNAHAASSNTTVERHRFWLNLSSVDDTGVNTMENQMLVAYITGATNLVDDGYDGLAFSDYSTQLASKIEDKNYIIQGRQLPFNSSDVVNLAFKATTAGTFEISLVDTDGLFMDDSQEIYIRDTEQVVVHNLKDAPYIFTSAEGTFDERFEVVYTEVPLSITDFDTKKTVVYVSDNTLHIESPFEAIQEVRIFDIAGRLLFEENTLNTQLFTTSKLPTRKEVILVQFRTQSGTLSTQKVVF